MKNSGKVDLASRAAEKRASRRADAARLKAGERLDVLQQKNSIFPAGFFENARISNRKQSLGR
jgi:hypothetical protein